MASVYHMVHYRKAQINPHNENSLERLCRDALSSVDQRGRPLWIRVQDRVCEVVDEEGRQVVLNRVADLNDAVFGEMCLMQDKGFQALLDMRAAEVQLSNITLAEIYQLEERSAPNGTNFVRGIIYFLSVGNHLFFVRTQSTQAAHIRDYLGWLLTNRGSVVPDGTAVVLQAEFDRAQFAGDIGEVRSLRVSGRASTMRVDVANGAEAQSPRIVERARRVAERAVEFGQAVPVVEALLGPAKTQSLVDSLGDNEYLAVEASIKIRGRRTEQSRVQLRAIANELADTAEAKVQIEGRDGKVSNDDAILRTRMPFALANEGSSILDFDNVADQLQEVYSRFVRDGKIGA